jgi:pentatricopeptide repeat protein
MAGAVLATVLFSDIVGSSERAAALGNNGWSELLARHDTVVRTELERFGGIELDNAGDGFLASFDAPGQAVRCAAAIVDRVTEVGLSVRTGVHTGECERIGKKLGGIAVHIGARVCAEAGAGEVLVSSPVHDMLAGAGLAFVDRGLYALKGIPGDWRLYALDRQRRHGEARMRIQLCGRLAVELDGRRVEAALPGRQGRLLLAYLALNRRRPVARDQLADAIWPDRTPDAAESSLSALLSKLRRVLGHELLDGRSSIQLQLPAHSWLDVESAMEAIHRAESAVRGSDWPTAWSAARVALHIARRPFLAGEEAPWIEDVRRQLADVHTRSLEATATAGLAIGGSELDTAERSARTLIGEAPYRESGYRLLMEALARRDNVAEALRVYDELRRKLRDELGAAPSTGTQELHRALLTT